MKPVPFRFALLLPLALAACHATPDASAPDGMIHAPKVVYRCDDGRQVEAHYPDQDTAKLSIDGHEHSLKRVISASGARYTGEQLQWWTRGMKEGWLAPLAAGETIASATGVSCTAP